MQKGVGIISVSLALALADTASAQLRDREEHHLFEETTWTGKNGKSIRGVYMTEKGDTIHVVNPSSGRHFKLDRKNLSAETLAWFERAKGREFGGGAATPAREPADGFVPLYAEKLDRGSVPSLAQSEYGHKASDCLPNAYAMFFVWWDRAGVFAIPKGRDDEDKAHWVHKEFARKFATRNNSGTYHDEVRKGMADYFERHFEGRATFELEMDYDYRPANLAALTVGGDATVLSVTTYNGRRKAGGHAVSLLKADAEGNVVFNTWGETFHGKMKPLEPSRGAPWRQQISERYEIELDPDREIPKWMERQEVRFLLEPENWDGVSVLKVKVKPEADTGDDGGGA